MSVAKLVQGWIDPERMDDAAAAVADDLIPLFVAQPGAQHGYWMGNRADGHVLIMMTWVDEEAVRESRAADGMARAIAAERVGLRVTAVQTMELIGDYEVDASDSAQRRWARATWVERLPVDTEIDMSALHRETVPDQSRSRGFRGSYWLGDRHSGNGLALSFWDGPAAMRDSGTESRRRRRRVEAAIGCRISMITEYEAIGAVTVTPSVDLRGVAVEH